MEPTGSRVLLRRSDVSWGAARGERPAPNESELDTARTFGEQAERRDAPERVGPVRSLWLRPHHQQRHRTLYADWWRCQGEWSEDGKKASWLKSRPLRRTGTSRRGQQPLLSPPSGPASVSCNGPHLKSKFLAMASPTTCSISSRSPSKPRKPLRTPRSSTPIIRIWTGARPMLKKPAASSPKPSTSPSTAPLN